jgi:hypothetical protein
MANCARARSRLTVSMRRLPLPCGCLSEYGQQESQRHRIIVLQDVFDTFFYNDMLETLKCVVFRRAQISMYSRHTKIINITINVGFGLVIESLDTRPVQSRRIKHLILLSRVVSGTE